jgi:hypothetical protein
MKLRLPILLSLAGLLVAVGTIATACGGGDNELTLEAYFQRVEAIASDIDARLEPLQADLEGATDDPTVFRDVFVEYVAIIRDAAAKVSALEPPAEVQEAHNEFRDALAALGDEFDGVAGQLGEAQSSADVLAVLQQSDSQLSAVQERLSTACLALQGIADENGITADLRCG